jgi:hypothetical protein
LQFGRKRLNLDGPELDLAAVRNESNRIFAWRDPASFGVRQLDPRQVAI